MNPHLSRAISEFTRITNLLLNDFVENEYVCKIKPVPLTETQLSILKIIKLSKQIEVGKIAELTQISHAAASKNIDKLVQSKLVTRKITARDRRRTNVSLLRTGEKIVEEYEAIRRKKQKIAFATFSEREKQQFLNLLRKCITQCLTLKTSLDPICVKCDGSIVNECVLGRDQVKCRFLS